MKVIVLLTCLGLTTLQAQVARWIFSTGSASWVESPVKLQTFDGTDYRLLVIDPDIAFQTIDGFGGCFNERGWDALSYLSESDRRQVLRDLFDPYDGCRFTLCRMPVGANDYSFDYYSLAEIPEDYDMQHFSMEREHRYLIPYIKAAMEFQPDLKLFASPWSPPQWMKINRFYACQGEQETSRLRWEPQVLRAYALYFSKFIQAYRSEGINLVQLHVQNEVDACQIFPSCLWSGEELTEFYRDYLIPRLDADGIDIELWLGTINHGDIRKYADVMFADPVCRARVTGVSYQWDGKHAVADTRRKYPEKKLMQSENECGDGSNDVKAGLYTFSLMKKYFEGGVNSYIYWNMVLDESGMSTWGWKQNSMITVDRYRRQARYNFEFYVMKHFSRFIDPGAVRVKAIGYADDALAFRNPDGSIVVVMMNDSFNVKRVTVRLGKKMAQADLPSGSVSTLVFREK
ncbi:MAG: glycosyl hydrolase [candidate division KSB1 bacterium]|nr:glycosyl hydrolase [candidate division KSB1 bacterium]MDZ7345639.1 glycosyl hydrolase [candidate division KSB1 bacterium]